MKLVGIVLVVLGLVALAYVGMGYNRDRTVLQVGSMSATVTEHKSVTVPAILGVVSLAGGLALLLLPKRRFLFQKGS